LTVATRRELGTLGRGLVALCLVAAACSTGSGRPAHGTSRNVSVAVLGDDGPVAPAGPFAATSLSALDSTIQSALAGRPLACFPMPCWTRIHPPPNVLLVSFRPALVSCYAVKSVAGSLDGRSLQLNARLSVLCTAPAAQATRGSQYMVAVPLADLPGNQVLRITVTVGSDSADMNLLGSTELHL
jgi:hypothetical protein